MRKWKELNTKRYYEFVNTVIRLRGQWCISAGTYYEAHHIVPVKYGGLPKHNSVHKSHNVNIIWLYPEEHFIAHKILKDDNPDELELCRAYACLAITKKPGCNRYVVSADEYADAKRFMSKSISGDNHDKLTAAAHTESASKKRSESLKGRVPWNKGKTKNTDEKVANASAKISASHKKVVHDKNWNENVSKALKGNPKCVHIKGKRKYTNGATNKFFAPGSQPDGYLLVEDYRKLHRNS